MSNDCIFCKIVAGEIPCTKIYEDDDTLAFIDIGPIIKGHALVIPKTHYDPLTSTPEPVLAKLIGVVRKITQAMEAGLKTEGINIIQNNGRPAGQLVPHIHFHVIPRFSTDGHRWNWDAKSYSGPEEMEQYAEAIRPHVS